MSYNLRYSNRFLHSLKRMQKRGCDTQELNKVLHLLAADGTLPSQYKPHKLVGEYANLWECHIQPDWLLI